MTMCEKCWADAFGSGDQPRRYRELLEERKDNPCTPRQQAGQWWDEEEQRDRRSAACSPHKVVTERYDTGPIMQHMQEVNAEINRLALDRDTQAKRADAAEAHVAELENELSWCAATISNAMETMMEEADPEENEEVELRLAQINRLLAPYWRRNTAAAALASADTTSVEGV